MASIADRMSALASPAKKSMGRERPERDGGGEDGEKTVIHHHPDGKHSVEHHDGETTGPHEHLHEAFAHISAKHHPDEGHSHVMHNQDGSHTSHHVKDGAVSGPHEHDNLDSVHAKMEETAGDGAPHSRDEEDGGMWSGTA
jgi:hypothetical protein